MSDIRKYLLDDNRDYMINQGIIGWKYAFWGYIVKKWIGDMNTKGWFVNINRKLITLLVIHCVEYWKGRNELHNDKRVNREYIIC